MRSIVYDVLADADTRASLLQSGVTAGYDNGAVLGSSDGNWLLRTNLLMQQRFIWNNQDRPTTEDRYGFENTRSKFIMTGHVVSPDWFFRIDHNVGTGMRSGTLNAYLGYDYGNGNKVTMGTMKVPFLREELVEAQYQLAGERSLMNNTFTGGYTDGVAFSGEGDQLRWAVAFTDGARQGQTAFDPGSGFLFGDTEWAFTGRVEYLASGMWDQFDDMTSAQGSAQGIMIGGALHYQSQEFGTAAGPEVETLAFTIDASVEGDGWNGFAAFVYADLNDDTSGGVDFSPWGFVIQGGFYLQADLEMFARYEMADFDGLGGIVAPGTNIEDLGVLTFGVNKYFSSHNAKWTTDILIGTDEIDGTVYGFLGTGDTGLRADDSGEDGQIALRTQLQILF
jgi:hypothetical protein